METVALYSFSHFRICFSLPLTVVDTYLVKYGFPATSPYEILTFCDVLISI